MAVIHLGGRLPDRSSDRPGSSGGPPSDASLLGLAPGGVCHACRVTTTAVGSYPTFSPLPVRVDRRSFFCGTFQGLPPPGVTRHPALWSSDFPLELKNSSDRRPTLPRNLFFPNGLVGQPVGSDVLFSGYMYYIHRLQTAQTFAGCLIERLKIGRLDPVLST